MHQCVEEEEEEYEGKGEAKGAREVIIASWSLSLPFPPPLAKFLDSDNTRTGIFSFIA